MNRMLKEIFVSILALPTASEHAGGASRVSFAHPDRRLFRAPMALLRQSAWSGSDQIEGTEAMCGPRRPKGLVVATQGHGEHPAATSRRRTLGKKYRTTYLGGKPDSGLRLPWVFSLESERAAGGATRRRCFALPKNVEHGRPARRLRPYRSKEGTAATTKRSVVPWL